MRPALLIVTDREDFAADYVIVRLIERGLGYYRLNSDQLAETAIEFRAGDALSPMRRVACGEASMDLETVRCVWFRRALRPTAPDVIDPNFRAFAAAELRHLFEGLVADPEIHWVNPLAATELAERKIYQLRTAERHGLRVPPTIVSTDREALVQFAANEDHVICKPISQGLINARGQVYAVHTREITRAQIVETDTLGGIPLLLQRCVPKGMDIRVTIIGDAIYPVEVITPSGAPVDWRATREGLVYRLCELPSDVERACRSFMTALGIVYGAFDFVRTDESEWFFLEVNPAGEWAWLDVVLGLSMRDALIDLLYGES